MRLFEYNTSGIINIAKLLCDIHGYHNTEYDRFKFVVHYKYDNFGKPTKSSEVFDNIEDAVSMDGSNKEIWVEYYLPNNLTFIIFEIVLNKFGGLEVNTDSIFEHYNDSIHLGELLVEDYNKIISMDKLISKI